ncbi:hypothetical protein GE09DRAFT_988232 [Coniochaeta sp. 2T2.1]|nr:hypothetical protein GE09DRAFT_988232 [Coniochaeta sp. 2T2.1]
MGLGTDNSSSTAHEDSVGGHLLASFGRSARSFATGTWTCLSRRVLRLAVTVPLIVLFLLYMFQPPRGFSDYQIDPLVENTQAASVVGDIPQSPPALDQAIIERISREAFIQDFLATDITGAYNGQSLYDLCQEQKWDESVIFECPPLEGGYGNVRQETLQCLRMTIAVGGSMIMPQISIRNPNDISDFRTSDMAPFSYLFDEEHFKNTLASYCPQLKIYDSLDSLSGYPSVDNPISLTPIDLPGLDKNDKVIAKPEQYPLAFGEWLKRENNPPKSHVRIAFTNRIIWTWPTSSDPPAFVRSFSSIIRPRLDIRLLAASALYTLKQRYGLPASVRPINGLQRDTFVGVHLRVEADANKFGFTNYSLQADYFLRRLAELSAEVKAKGNGELVIYVASGDEEQVARFAEQIAPLRVATKRELLDGGQLDALSWDQQALVDLLMLERSSYLMGVRESSFTWTLVLKRAAAVNWVVGGFPTGPCWVNGPKGEKRRRGCKEDLAPEEFWRDDLSVLVGPQTKPTTESIDVVRSTIFP